MSTIGHFFTSVTTAAEKAGIAIEDAFIFLGHFAKAATPIAEAIETVSGNAELVPITATVSTAVQAVGQVAENTQTSANK